MQSPRLSLTFADSTARDPAPEVVVAPRNEGAARMALRVWIGVAGFAVLYELLGGDTLYPPLALAGATVLLAFALPSGRAVEVRDEGLVRRGLILTHAVPWSRVDDIQWSRHGGVEKLTARAGLSRVTLSNEGAGFTAAARRVRALAAFRGIPVTAQGN